MLVGTIGYGLAALAFGLLTFLALTSWRGRLPGALLVIAAGVSAAWAVAAALSGDVPGHWRLLGSMEVLRNTAWLVFIGCLTPSGQGINGRMRQLAALVPAAFILVFGLTGILLVTGTEPLPQVIGTLVFTGLLTAIAGLVLLEQVYRSLRLEPRKAVLPLIIGLGAILAYDLFLYSHGLLFRGLHLELWSARGFANLLATPLLLLAARRNPSWSIDVFVSRHVAFFTTSIVAIGIYLLVMAIAGYALRLAGGQWGAVLQVVFLFGAAVLLAWIMFSSAARARLKVFIAKHFYSNKYDYRVEWLKLTRRLAEADNAEPLPQRGLSAMVELAGAEGGALWVSDAAREAGGFQHIASIGPFATEWQELLPATLASEDPLIGFLADRRWTINVSEAKSDPETHQGLSIPDWLVRLDQSSLIVPLLNRDDLFGLALIIRPKSVGRLSYEDIDLFRVAGMQVAAVLAQAESDRLLSENRQFEAYNRFAAFIMHDLKNVIAQQSLVVRNAAKYRDDPDFIDDALDTVSNSVERMQRLLEQLKRGQGAAHVERVDITRLVLEIVHRHMNREPQPTADCPDAPIKVRIDRERLAAVLSHLVTNAQDATPRDGHVHIVAGLEDDWLVLVVEDDGSGMDQVFVRERLFKPFDSTKGSKGMGIGAYQARQFVESVGGEVRVHTAVGQGTRFELRFPAALIEERGDAVAERGDAGG